MKSYVEVPVDEFVNVIASRAKMEFKNSGIKFTNDMFSLETKNENGEFKPVTEMRLCIDIPVKQ